MSESADTRYDRLRKLMFEDGAENAWSFIDCASLSMHADGHEWMDVGDELDALEREFELLTGLGLAVVHPEHPEWIRRIDPPSPTAA